MFIFVVVPRWWGQLLVSFIFLSLTFSYKTNFLLNAISLYSRFAYLLDYSIIISSLDMSKSSRSILSRFPGYVRLTHKLPLLYTFFPNSIQSNHIARPPWYSLFCDHRLNYFSLITQCSNSSSYVITRAHNNYIKFVFFYFTIFIYYTIQS